MRIDGQLQNFWGPLFPIGIVSCRDQIPQSQIFGFDPAKGAFCVLPGFHNRWNGEAGFRDVSQVRRSFHVARRGGWQERFGPLVGVRGKVIAGNHRQMIGVGASVVGQIVG